MTQFLSLLTFLAPAFAHAGVEWPQFRGPNGDGHAAAERVPVQWSDSEHIQWKAAVPGRGWSSPVLGDGVVWLTTAVEQPADENQIAIARFKNALNPMVKELKFLGAIQLRAIAVDANTGNVRHDVLLFDVKQPQPAHSLNSYASPSPILDGQRLYCHFGTFGTACVDTASASVVWKTQLPNDHSVGPGSSPTLHDGLLIVPCDGADSQSVVALDVHNGEKVWTTKRPKMKGFVGDLHKAFSTPLVIQHEGTWQAIAVGAQWAVAYDPRTGDEIWKLRYGDGFSNAPRPIVGHGLVYICTGYTQQGLWAIKLGGTGELSDSHIAWKMTKQTPGMVSPILVDDLLFAVTDQGVLTCLDAKTGQTVWQHRLGGNFSASPIYADGKLYFCNRDGRTTVVKPGREYQEIAVNDIDGQLMASPVAVDGALVLRTATHLYRIGK